MKARLQTLLARVPADVWWFVVPMLILAPLKFEQAAGQRWMSIDGGYYTEIARHVRDGLGFTTNVSLNNFGYETFPHPTSVYPLWPVMLGLIGKVTDLYDAAHWVPTVLYLAAVCLAFAFGRRVWPQPIFPEGGVPLHAGHVLAAILASNRQFILFTALPYTEGVSWFLFFAFFLRLAKKSGQTSVGWGLELGCWLSLLYFARAQFMLVPLAVGGAIFFRFLLGPDRGRWLGLGLSALVPLGLTLGAWWAWLRTFLYDLGPLSLLRFDQNRVNTLLSPFDVIVEDQGFADVVRDRLSGLSVAYDLVSGHSWHASFGAAHWALPVAFVVAVGTVRQWGPGWFGRQVATFRSERGVLQVSMVLLAIGGLVSIQMAHKHFNGEWYFYRRQGMIAIFAFVLPMLWLLRRGRGPALVALGLTATTLSMGAFEIVKDIQAGSDEDDEDLNDDKFNDMVGWLKQHSSPEAPLTVAFEEGNLQRIAWRTGNVNYHWVAASSPYSDLRTMVDKLHVQYLILADKRRKSWALWKDGAGHLEAEFARLPESPSHFQVLQPRTEPVPQPVSRKVLLIGVDGMSWDVMGPMIARGELPNFRKLWVEGASQTAFDTMDSTDSPVVWTSVATGRDPKDHGIVDYVEEIEGGKVPITSNSRKVPAIWNIASKAGLSVGVVNWWASWPAEEVNGYAISDHANPAAAGWMDKQYWSADPAKLAAMNVDTWPRELGASIEPLWIKPDAFPKDDFMARAQLTPEQWAKLDAAPYNERTAYSWLKTFYTLDEPHVRIAVDKLKNDPKDLTMVYLRGPDPIQHYAWNLVEPYAYEKPPKHLDRDRGIVEGVYRYTDTFVGELIAAAPPDTTIIVHSDHGAEPCPAKSHHSKERPGCHTKTAKGVFFISGPGVAPGTHLGGASPIDVMPTMAWILGLPISEELPGHPLSEAFEWDYAARFGRTDVETYGPREGVTAPTTASPADAQMLQQLEGLGYIE